MDEYDEFKKCDALRDLVLFVEKHPYRNVTF